MRANIEADGMLPAGAGRLTGRATTCAVVDAAPRSLIHLPPMRRARAVATGQA